MTGYWLSIGAIGDENLKVRCYPRYSQSQVSILPFVLTRFTTQQTAFSTCFMVRNFIEPGTNIITIHPGPFGGEMSPSTSRLQAVRVILTQSHIATRRLIWFALAQMREDALIPEVSTVGFKNTRERV